MNDYEQRRGTFSDEHFDAGQVTWQGLHRRLTDWGRRLLLWFDLDDRRVDYVAYPTPCLLLDRFYTAVVYCQQVFSWWLRIRLPSANRAHAQSGICCTTRQL